MDAPQWIIGSCLEKIRLARRYLEIKTALAQLRWLLDPDTIYGDVEMYFDNFGKTLLFLDEDEYAILAYQMRIGWVELDDTIVQEMTCTCDNCGTESPFQ
jgi:hypothetical protein